MPQGGKISQLNVGLHDCADRDNCTTSGAGSWTFVLLVNPDTTNPNHPAGDQDLICTIGPDEDTCSDLDNTVTINAGDKIALMGVPSCKNPNYWGPLTSTDCPKKREMRWSAVFDAGAQ
jgi:hypothetical protein